MKGLHPVTEHRVRDLFYVRRFQEYHFILDQYPIPLSVRVVNGLFRIPLEVGVQLLDPKSMALYAAKHRWYDHSMYKPSRLTMCFVRILQERLK
jgi:hypothetical protein